MLKVCLNYEADGHTKFKGNMYDHHRPTAKLSCFSEKCTPCQHQNQHTSTGLGHMKNKREHLKLHSKDTLLD